MTDRDALLAAILSDPADDLPRLCFADWLDENGESEQSEFIRVQVELSRWKPKRGLDRDAPIGLFGERERRFHKYGKDFNRRDELRRRERELFAHDAVFGWFPVPTDRMVATCHRKRNEIAFKQFESSKRINSVRTAPATEQTYYVSRGFISSICLSWQDWLHHHEALYWHPKQTAECRGCGVIQKYDRDEGVTSRIVRELVNGCKSCSGAKRVPQPFVATAQPITEVELTTWPEELEGVAPGAYFVGYQNCDWHRVKCPACGGLGLVNAVNGPIVAGDPVYQCPACRGEPLKWTCDRWPTITFKMP